PSRLADAAGLRGRGLGGGVVVFFQAEDGIRARNVTGVQTCALPISDECCAGLDTVGIRMPSHPVVRQVIEASGCAFAAPSANLSGKPSPTTAQDVWTDMQGRLPLILDGGPCAVGVESTVVSVAGEKPVLFRPGYITLEDLERALGEEVELSPAILEKLAEGEVARSPGMKYKHYAPKAEDRKSVVRDS